jgi:hypothetical protein
MSPQVPKAGRSEEVLPGDTQQHARHRAAFSSVNRAATHAQNAAGRWAPLAIEKQSHIWVYGNAAPRGRVL